MTDQPTSWKRPSRVYATDEDGNVLWAVAASDDDCPLCTHPFDKHSDPAFGCGATLGYDHMNGFHECECPLLPLALDEVFGKGSDICSSQWCSVAPGPHPRQPGCVGKGSTGDG